MQNEAEMHDVKTKCRNKQIRSKENAKDNNRESKNVNTFKNRTKIKEIQLRIQ